MLCAVSCPDDLCIYMVFETARVVPERILLIGHVSRLCVAPRKAICSLGSRQLLSQAARLSSAR